MKYKIKRYYLQSFSNLPNVTIFGDLNLPDVRWDGYYSISSISQFFAYDLNLIQLVSQPTHRAGSTLG